MRDRGEKFDREALYRLVWSEPVTKVAARYGYSDVGFAKLCRSVGVPLPERGYWARVAAGSFPRKIPLPRSRPDQDDFVFLKQLSESAQANRESALDVLRAARAAAIVVATDQTEHPAVVATASWAKENPTEADELRKRFRLSFSCSATSEQRGVLLLSRLVRLMEANGGSVERENGQLTASLSGTSLRLAIVEKVSRVDHEKTPQELRAISDYQRRSARGDFHAPYPRIPQYDYLSTGILTLSCEARNWNDTARTPLEERLGTIIGEVLVFAIDKKAQEDEDAERQRRYAERVRVYEESKSRRSAERSDLLALRKASRHWVTANQIRAYVQAYEQDQRERGGLDSGQQDWIDWARRKADWLDPLVPMSDVVLDSPPPKPPGYIWEMEEE